MKSVSLDLSMATSEVRSAAHLRDSHSGNDALTRYVAGLLDKIKLSTAQTLPPFLHIHYYIRFLSRIFAMGSIFMGLFSAQIYAAVGSGLSHGLPIIRIDTKNEAPISDRENYVPMRFVLTDPNNPINNVTLSAEDFSDGEIRGRGKGTWNYSKKPYHIKFDKKKSLFGLTAAKSWILLAEYLDPTFLTTSTTFHLGDVFGVRFNHHVHHVQLYMNGQYEGIYLLTEHNQVGKGRVDIDETEGWFVGIDAHYDEDPKFKTISYNLPIMIKSPNPEPADISDPTFGFVIKDINELTDSLASPNFPENGYRDLIDMNTFIDFLMINEIVKNNELYHPKSVYSYKDNGGKISMGPLWDFDWAFGLGGTHTFQNDNWIYSYSGHSLKYAFFNRFFEDPVFLVKYKERWNEKYTEIFDVPTFIDELSGMLEAPFADDYNRWKDNGYESDYPKDYMTGVRSLKTWWNNRVSWLDAELNNAEVLPKDKTFASQTLGYSEIAPQTFTLVTYGNAVHLSATLQKADMSDFEIIGEPSGKAAGNGGYLTTVRVKPKISLSAAAYGDTLIVSGENQGHTFTIKTPLTFVVNEAEVAVLTPDRTIPALNHAEEAATAAPVTALTAYFAAGPNPVCRSSGALSFFRQGPRISSASLSVYDDAGNVVKKITVRDSAASTQSKRRVGSWDLADKKGRPVSDGTYLLKGVIKTVGGKSERVSLILGVR